jgi:hypothetical protein
MTPIILEPLFMTIPFPHGEILFWGILGVMVATSVAITLLGLGQRPHTPTVHRTAALPHRIQRRVRHIPAPHKVANGLLK